MLGLVLESRFVYAKRTYDQVLSIGFLIKKIIFSSGASFFMDLTSSLVNIE